MTEKEWEESAWGHTHEPDFRHGTHKSRRSLYWLEAGCLLGSAGLFLGVLGMILVQWWRS